MTPRSRLLWAVPIVLAVTACGAAATGARLTPAGNKLVAQRDAGNLLHLSVLPSGAQRVASAPSQPQSLLQEPGMKPATPDIVDRHSFWLVQSPLASVVAFMKGHAPRGSRQEGGGWRSGPGIPDNRQLVFSFPPISGRITTRWLNVTAVALSRRMTALRIDALDVWIVPRSPSEKVPSGVHEIDITSAYLEGSPGVSVSVVNAREVSQTVRWIDALGAAQPGVISCPSLSGPTVTFDFRSASHAILARASMLDSQLAGPCNSIQFSVRDRQSTPLIAGKFLTKVERLLKVSFRRRVGK